MNQPMSPSGGPVHEKSPATKPVNVVKLWLGLAVALVLAAVFAGWVLARWVHVRPPIRSLAVLPFGNVSGDPGQEKFVRSMTDELTAELARIHGLRIISPNAALAAGGADKSLPQIANKLKLDALVEGSVLRSSKEVRITVKLMDARNGKLIWAQDFEGQIQDIPSFQRNVAKEIASQARVPPLQ